MDPPALTNGVALAHVAHVLLSLDSNPRESREAMFTAKRDTSQSASQDVSHQDYREPVRHILCTHSRLDYLRYSDLSTKVNSDVPHRILYYCCIKYAVSW